MKLKIAIVVHGRFHAFDLARAIATGTRCHTFHHWPRWAVKRFDFPESRVRSFWLHGVMSRAASKLHRGDVSRHEEWFHTLFGRWAATELAKEHWDVVHSWSGVSEEILHALAGKSTFKLLMRGSAHIVTQARLLEEEERRVGKPQDRPSRWVIAREKREYELVDAIAVLSTFSYSTFVAEGFPKEKLRILLFGASLDQFRPNVQIYRGPAAANSFRRASSVLNVGMFSFRKGVWDLAEIIKCLSGERFDFRFVRPHHYRGSVPCRRIKRFRYLYLEATAVGATCYYAWGDIFILPTIEDGFALVLGQTAASALPILTTPNGAGRDLVRAGETQLGVTYP